LNSTDNDIDLLFGFLLPEQNSILKFRASNNRFWGIEAYLIDTLKDLQMIDLTGNNCIDTIYDKNSAESISIEALRAQLASDCYFAH
jgi:hypothetical protein